MSNYELDRIKGVMPIVDKVSPTMCLAKWHHVTIYLQSGETHSCYHPAPHKIPLGELENNPSALHNTAHKKQERLQMLNGERPTGCQYCWNVEDLGGDQVSDRHIRTASIYRYDRWDQVVKGPWDQNINPEYIEISFGNECNFMCGYCHPKASSRYHNEIKKFGPYVDTHNHRCDIDWFKVYEEETNPYVKAWWDWWPEVSKTLNILRITGGEPLMHKSTFRLLDELDRNPVPHLELNINTNLGAKPALVVDVMQRVKKLLDEKKIREFKTFTSIDTWNPRAEYIRTGLDLETFERNLDTVMTLTGKSVTFMITFNALTVTTFSTLLQKILEWRAKYNTDPNSQLQRLQFDTPYLKEPLQFDMNILPKEEYMPYMYEHLQFMKNNLDEHAMDKFSMLEYKRFERNVKYMESRTYAPEIVGQGRADFFGYFSEYDRRRNQDFTKTFPEMTDFWNMCKESYEQRKK